MTHHSLCHSGYRNWSIIYLVVCVQVDVYYCILLSLFVCRGRRYALQELQAFYYYYYYYYCILLCALWTLAVR